MLGLPGSLPLRRERRFHLRHRHQHRAPVTQQRLPRLGIPDLHLRLAPATIEQRRAGGALFTNVNI